MLSVVTGFWKVGNKYGDNYFYWLRNSLKINAPYIFFGTEETIKYTKEVRKDLPTHYIEMDITELEAYKYKDYIVTDHVHCPSKELAVIWLSKLFLIRKAVDINPFNTELFAWIDAGIYMYRNLHPPLKTFDANIISRLPTDKFIFSSSEYPMFIPQLVQDNNIYHYISGNFIISKYLIFHVCLIYKDLLEEKLPLRQLCFSNDQVFYTIMYKLFGDSLFYKLSDGYGSVVNDLYMKNETDNDSEKIVGFFKKKLLYHDFDVI